MDGQNSGREPAAVLHLDDTVPPLRSVHGVNLGPVERPWNLDYTPLFQQARIPSIRTHDASLFIGDVVDLHTIFPNPAADPHDPANYQFELTDWYFERIRGAGAEIYLRLGESIEHAPEKVYIRPERWNRSTLATVCANIVRHYNQGWHHGFRYGIRHVEFWNEPDNGWDREPHDRKCFTGDANDFLDLYTTVASAVRAVDPARLGMAGFVRPWFLYPEGDPQYVPGWSELIDRVVAAQVPLDFVSWHCYTNSWQVLGQLTTAVRAALDQRGLGHVESHVTEWRWFPQLADEQGSFSFGSVMQERNYDRTERALAAMNNHHSAAFTFGALVDLSDSDVAMAHLYSGIGSYWGIFHPSGRPTPTYHALATYGAIVDESTSRVRVELHDDDLRMVVLDGGTSLSCHIAYLPKADRADHTIRLTPTRRIGLLASIELFSLSYDGVWAPSPSSAEVVGDDLVVRDLQPGVHLLRALRA